MKSLAVVTTAFPTEASFVEADVRRLHERGVRVRVFALRSPRGRRWQPDHDALLPLTRWVGSPFHPAAWLALLGWLVRKPHVLLPEWARMVWASRRSRYALIGHLAYLPAAARIARLVEQEGFDAVHAAWAHFPGSVAYLVARLTGRPFSMSAHAGSDLYRTQAFLAEKARRARFTAACVARNAVMLRALAGPAARVECVYHGVDLGRFDGAGRARDPEPLLIAVGRLSRAKGFDLAVEALGVLARQGLAPRLVLVGDGPERPRLEALARSLGVEGQVAFTGALPQREVVGLYRRAWLLLAPSRVLASGRRDGIPNVTVEAMAMGVPVLGTAAGGLDEAVTPGENGALVGEDDPEALAGAIATLLADPAALDRLGERARARVRRDFDAERNFERLFALLGGESRAAEDVA
jgi:glycosyltransferase involved in cell wall biosynthesis